MQAFALSNGVVISQVYGGAGCTTAGCSTYKNDYIELFNRGTSAVALNGWSVQYASAAGTTWAVTPLTNVNLQPGQYYLVQEGSGPNGNINIPTPDAPGTIAMSATAAKVALVSSTVALSGSCPSGGALVDLVGYGTGPTCFETALAPAPGSNFNAIFRGNGGCNETDNNSADFAAASAGPRNTLSATHSCVVVNNPPTITNPANPIATVQQNSAPFTVSLSGSDDGSVYNWGATAGTGISAVSVTGGQGTSSVTYTVTLTTNFTGTATFTASLSDNVNTPATTKTVNIAVNAANNPPTITAPANPITTVEANAPAFTVSLTGTDDGSVYNWSATPGTGISTVSVTGGQGTHIATFTVNLQGGFSGTATFTASLSDNVNTPTTQAVNITVTPPPPPPNHVVISQVYGGGGNSGATYQNDYVELYNPTASTVDLTGWTLQYQAATSTGTWASIQPIGGIIGPGEYYLVSLASGGATGAPLPAANIVGGTGTINMSATAGKIAVVSNGDPLVGCPFTVDPDLVDLVGYGTTATCREGSTNAPAASNTTALFRKNGGLTDTDVNGSDFLSGAPNPRRTAPIVEIGPVVTTVDPINGASVAPKDASITVTFSEPVTVDANWYDITCASGQHNDATQTSTDGGATWVITPNVSFNAGESCTVTIFATAIHDVDTDDSGPNSDNLPANKVWSFTTSTGQPAPYGPEVHLTMGNPSNAVDDVNVPNNYLMMKPTYALSYNRDKGTPNWVSWHLETAWYGSLARVDTFRPDPKVPASWYRVQAFDFQASGFDRGHMTPNADRDNENRIPINQETYLMSNMVPQAPDNNQGPWANLENYLRSQTDAGAELYIVSGPAGVGGTGSNGGVTTTLANGHVTVPAYTWKVVLVLPKLDGDDVSRVTAATRTIAVIMPNVQGIRTSNSSDWMTYLTSVDAVEQLTGYNFFSNVPEAIQNAVEAGVNGANPPGTANQSVSTNEDNAKSFTLDVASPNNAAVTYTIVTGPSHGTLAGTDGNRTYTPAPDYNGNDTFTYNVSDGTHTSNTSTVNLTVLEMNDAPAAADDAKTTDEDTPLTFASSDLTGNDSAGPSNESGQTLTVSSVSSTASTHGSVSLVSGNVTYSPDANYNGPASFTYQVCDNGLTAGVADPKCATATVNMTVNAVNDPPTATITAPSTGAEGSSISVSGSAFDVDDTSFTFSWSITKNGSPYATGNGTPFSFTPDDNGTYGVSLLITDAHGGTGSASASIAVSNVDPVISAVTGPTAPIALGNSSTIVVSYSDAGSADTQTATFTWDDTTSSTASCSAGTCTASHTFTGAGVYHVLVTVIDDDGGTASSDFQYVVVYDTAAGFVTGGGWINSPAGAYVANPDLVGKATFGFVSKYQKGQQKPQGNTQFQFAAAGFQFVSTSYDWLVIAGSKAQYKGTGTIANTTGTFAFLLTATDGDMKGGNAAGPDKFRIKIWNADNGSVVYDNVLGGSDDLDAANPQVLGGGSIQIQQPGK